MYENEKAVEMKSKREKLVKAVERADKAWTATETAEMWTVAWKARTALWEYDERVKGGGK